MEQEKLDEARRCLQEDKEKFEKLLSDSDKLAKNIVEEVKQKAHVKNQLVKEAE